MSSGRRQKNRVNSTGRSTGEGKHVRLYRWVIESSAYRDLSCRSRCLLTELYNLYNGMNNGELFLSVRNGAERIGASPNTTSKCFKELIDKGFIRPNQPGSFNWKGGAATTWILTEFEFNGEKATKDFMHRK
tara:strand:- start:435 stop:830 length:396 start_codon:yes stop_codon:yes gene_type:complete